MKHSHGKTEVRMCLAFLSSGGAGQDQHVVQVNDLIPNVWQCRVIVFPSLVNSNGDECAPKVRTLNSYTFPLWMNLR